MLLGIRTGARRGELISLQWRDIDLKEATATAHEAKNGDPRVLPLAGEALTALRELKLRTQSRWVFQQPSGFAGLYENFDEHWRQAVKATGIERFRFHGSEAYLRVVRRKSWGQARLRLRTRSGTGRLRW